MRHMPRACSPRPAACRGRDGEIRTPGLLLPNQPRPWSAGVSKSTDRLVTWTNDRADSSRPPPTLRPLAPPTGSPGPENHLLFEYSNRRPIGSVAHLLVPTAPKMITSRSPMPRLDGLEMRAQDTLHAMRLRCESCETSWV